MNTRTTTRFGVLLAVVAFALTGCAGSTRAAEQATTAGEAVRVSDAWVKSAESGMSAGFGQLSNDSTDDVTVVSASSDSSRMIELHETVENGSGEKVMRQKADGFIIPARGTFDLEPGGNHMMLMDLRDPLEAGGGVTFTLTLSDGSTYEFTAPVKDYFGANESYEVGGGPVESTEPMARPELSPGDVQKLRASCVSGQHIDENREWTPERRAWQEEQVNLFLDGIEPEKEGEAQVWFNGGGPGSGKSSFTSGKVDVGYPTTRGINDLTGEMDFAGMPNPGAALIDSDSVKMQLPEVKAMRQSQSDAGIFDNANGVGGNWADQSHAESTYIAKMIYTEAQRRNLNVVYDGTGTKIVGMAKEALATGYSQVNANYMYVEADQALTSAIERAGRIGRNVPPDIQADYYRVMPDAFNDVVDSGLFSHVSLWDRNGVSQGAAVPKIYEYSTGGGNNILDQAAYNRWQSSGSRVPEV